MSEPEKSKRWRKKNLHARKMYMSNYRHIGVEDIKKMLIDPDEIWFEKDARKRSHAKRATPSWADKAAIRAIYQQAVFESKRYGIEFVVVYIYPLRHKRFSGLNVPLNLRIVSMSYKKRMGRKFNKNYL